MKNRFIMALVLLCFAAVSCKAFTLPPDPAEPPPTVVSPGPVLAPPTEVVVTPSQQAVTPTTAPAVTGTPAADYVHGADNLGEPYYPQMGNGGYDALHYSIDLTVDVSNNKIDGSCTLDAQALADLLSFNLDLHGLNVKDVSVNGAQASFDRQNDELIITPAQALSKDEKFSVVVDYAGSPQPVDDPATFGDPVGWFADAGVYVVSEVNGAMGWYPVNNSPLDKATYTFQITAPKQYTVVANGVLKSEVENGSLKTSTWEAASPMASYLATVEIGNYKRETLSGGPKDLPVYAYFPPTAGSDIKNSFSRTGEMITYYSQIFGPYPFESYSSIVVPLDLGFALEDQTISIFGQDMADEITAAHELSHQWFGDSVSLKSWKDIWLNEGFATYAEALWIEHSEGKAAAKKYMANMYAHITAKNMPSPANPAVKDLFSEFVYLRGGWVLYALRLKVGDEIFFKIMQDYYGRYKYGNASTDDFIAVAEQVSGQDLKDFFAAWLYSDRIPPAPAQGN